jgi:hypothetical protein
MQKLCNKKAQNSLYLSAARIFECSWIQRRFNWAQTLKLKENLIKLTKRTIAHD